MNFYSFILMCLYFYGMPVVSIANIILAIVIICTKEKVTKLLGICAAINGVSSLLSSLYQLLIRYLRMVDLVRFANANSIASVFLGIASGVFLILYVNKRYGTKIYVGIILIAISSFLSMIIRVITGNLLPPGKFDNTEMYGYFMTLMSMLPVIAVDIVWLVIFIKNRIKEKDLNYLWLMRLFALIGASVYSMCYIISLVAADNADRSLQDAASTVTIFVSIFDLVVTFGFEIYILVKGSKASEEDKLTIVES